MVWFSSLNLLKSLDLNYNKRKKDRQTDIVYRIYFIESV